MSSEEQNDAIANKEPIEQNNSTKETNLEVDQKEDGDNISNQVELDSNDKEDIITTDNNLKIES